MRIAVIGGTGFVGSEIVKQALEQGHEVRILARTLPSAPMRGEFWRVDIRDRRSLQGPLKHVDVVINAAGLAHRPTLDDSTQYEAINASGAAASVDAAADQGVKRVVLLSSISIYGGNTKGEAITEDVPPSPSTTYGWSKLNGEMMARRSAAAHHLPLTILRLATVYGASDPGNFVRLINSILTGRFVWIGDGHNRKTLIHRSDAARACLLAAGDTSQLSPTLNVTDDIYSVRQIVTTVARLAQRRIGRLRIPKTMARLIAVAATQGGTRGRAFSMTLSRWLAEDAYSGDVFRKMYHFSPCWTLRDGLAEEIEWIRNRPE